MPEFTKTDESIFAAAVEMPAPERAAYLDQICGADAAMRQRIEGLLRSHDQAGSFLHKQPMELGATAGCTPLAEAAGTVIGRYKLLQPIGEGGFGVVYMAEQKDPVRRKVALKIIKLGMDSKEVIARFEAERQALALMDHPNIARVFDAGTTETGRPYFVMELVKGVPIGEFCDKNQLPARQRLELFTSVCQAVQHAHLKGIIHRDIKPSNVLVTLHDGRPVPKVIDFGVAKALNQDLTEKTLFTAFGHMVGTPQYMSPEQAEMSGLDVDTRSDVYSLGVLLYELLTGTTPLEGQMLRRAGYAEMQRLIREEESPRPSVRVSTLGERLSVIAKDRHCDPQHLHQLLRGELDWIVMKALEKDRTRRYETASAFAADVQRYLKDELVEARPPSAWYRFRKMARRNKAVATTLGLVAASLLLGLAVSAWQAVRATQAEADARASAEQAKKNAERALAGEKLARDNEMKAAASAVLATQAETEARKSEQLARDSEMKAVASAALALKQEQLARDNAMKLAASAALAKKNEYQAMMGLYGSNIANAHRELEADDLSIFYQYLDKCPPDFRGWEHDYLYTHVNQNLQTLARQNNAVSRVAFSPDGKRLATAAMRKTVKLWDLASGNEILTLPMEEGVITSLAFSPDGKRLATSISLSGPNKGGGGRGGAAGAVKLWDLVSGKAMWSQNENAKVSCVAFSPDGKRLVTSGGREASENNGQPTSFVKLRDATTGQANLSLSGHEKPVRGVAFSPDGRRLATASDDALVKLWELASGKEYLTLKGHTDLVGRVTFSPDGKRLASASIDKTLKVWDAASGQEILTLEKILTLEALGPRDIIALSVAFSPDGKLLASACDRTVMLLDAASGREVASFKGHLGIVKSVAFSPDGKRLASAAGEVRIWDVPASQAVLKFEWLWQGTSGVKYKVDPEFIPVQSNVAFSPDGKRVAAGLRDKRLKIWDLASRQEILALDGVNGLSVTFSPDGKRLACASNKTVKVWDAASGKEILTCKGHTDIVTHVAFSPDGKHLASASEDETVKIWDAITGQKVRSFEQRKYVFSVAFSPDGKRLGCASAGDKNAFRDKTLKVWDTASGQEIFTLNNFICAASRQRNVEFSPDGKLLASVSNETVKLWDAASGREVASFKGHTDRVNWVAFSPDGKHLASASFDKTVKLWDVANCQEVLTLTGTAYSLAFSPDGKRLASASNTVKLWDTVCGQEVLSLSHTREVSSLAFSPDGKRLAVKLVGSGVTGTDTMILWDASKSMKELEQK